MGQSDESFSFTVGTVWSGARFVWIGWRYFCPKFMRHSFHEDAGESVKHSFWDRAQKQIAQGKGRQTAVRTLAYKWLKNHLEVLQP